MLKLLLSLCSYFHQNSLAKYRFELLTNRIESNLCGKASRIHASNDIEEKDYAFHPGAGSFEDGKGGGGRVNDGIHAQALGFALNGGGGRASEIKRPVDGLFSCAVMYGLPSIFHPRLCSPPRPSREEKEGTCQDNFAAIRK